MRTDLVADLVAGRGDCAELTTAARAYGLDPRARSVCSPSSARTLEPAAHWPFRRTPRWGRAASSASTTEWSSPSSPRRTQALWPRRSRARIGRVARTTVAGVGPMDDVAAVPAAFTEAVRTVRAMVALGHAGTGAAAADLGFAGLVVGSEPDVRRLRASAARTPAGVRRRARHRSRGNRRGLLRRGWQPAARRDHAARARQHRRAAAGARRGPARCRRGSSRTGPSSSSSRCGCAASCRADAGPRSSSSRRSIASTTAVVPFEAKTAV